MKRGGPLRSRRRLAARPKRRTACEAEASALWIDRVLAKAARDRATGRRVCAVSGVPEFADDPLEGHHILPQALLRREAGALGVEAEELLWDARNGLPVRRSVHARHTSRKEPIPLAALRPENLEFADALGLRWVLERDYA